MSINKSVLYKLASIVEKQNEIITRLAQQAIDITKNPSTDPLGKVVSNATMSWSVKNKMSAKSNFSAGVDEKTYEVDVVLTITDPRKPTGPALAKAKETYKQSFLAILQAEFNKASQDTTSPLFRTTATFNVTVV